MGGEARNMLTAFTAFPISVSDLGTDGQDILIHFKFIYSYMGCQCLIRPCGESTRNKCSKFQKPLKAVETWSYNHHYFTFVLMAEEV